MFETATAPVAPSRSISLTQLLSSIQKPSDLMPKAATAPVELPSPPTTPAAQPSIDDSRTEMFSRYYRELEGRLQELREAMDGGLARSRTAMSQRVEEITGSLHRDSMVFRQEQQRETEDLKRDVFTAVMSLSAVNDRITALEHQLQTRLDAVQEVLALLMQRVAPGALSRA